MKPSNTAKDTLENETLKLSADNPPYIPSQTSNKHVLHNLLTLLQNKKYMELKTEARKYYDSGQEVSNFFSKKGAIILHYTLVTCQTSEALSTIIEIFPKEVKKTIIENNKLIDFFLDSESQLEEWGQYSQSRSKVQIEKFKLLLNIDYETVKSKIESSRNTKMTKNLEKNFLIAVEEYQGHRTASAVSL